MTKENIQELLQYIEQRGYTIMKKIHSPSLYNRRSVTEEEIDELINNYIDEIYGRRDQDAANQDK